MMETREYPTLFQESDSLAISAQRSHLRLTRIKIASLLAVGLIAAIAFNQMPDVPLSSNVILKASDLRLVGNILFTIFLILSFCLTAIVKEKHFDETWFSSRAVAEAVKAETWIFVMKTEPYDNSLSEIKVKEIFLERLHEILRANTTIASRLPSHLSEGAQITTVMEHLRAESPQIRKDFYIKNRIHDQRIWYANKAKWNEDQESKWSIAMWLLETLAIALAIFRIIVQYSAINPVGIVLAMSGGILSWINARSYSEASRSYGLLSQELAILEDRAKNSRPSNMGIIVAETESLVSQEHRVWSGRLL
jgi:hypothetical protein